MNTLKHSTAACLCVALLAWSALPVSGATPTPAVVAVTAERLAALCEGCAIVSEVKTETRKGKGGALGVVGGAVVGGVLGHQIGGGTGKTLATIVGAAAGGYAGNEVQKSATKTTVWLTRVTLKDGSTRTFENASDPGFKPGEMVVVDGDQIKKR